MNGHLVLIIAGAGYLALIAFLVSPPGLRACGVLGRAVIFLGSLLLAAALVAGSVPTLRRLRRRPSGVEKYARKALGMPPGHPEWLVGSDRAALRGHFPAWAAELEADGIDAGHIIQDFRSGT